jgi:CRP-like cAMP-binding protein
MSAQGSQRTGLFSVAFNEGRDRSAHRWASVLGTVPLFSGLSKRHLRRIADKATMKRYAPLTVIVRSGDVGDAFYVILEGSATVRRPGRRNVELTVGDFFGEMALLGSSPRTATVETQGGVLTLRLGRAAFQKVLESEPKVAVAMLKTLAARLSASNPEPTH